MAKKRKMGEGTLRHRKDGRWEGRMVIGYDENEYYFADLLGMKVVEEKDGAERLIGELTEVMETGANDVFVVRRENGRELLIPSIADCIRQVDVEQGKMTVTLLPGMEDDQ